MPTPPTELQRWELPGGRTLVLRRNEDSGQEFLDLRVHNPTTTSGPGLPTTDGICLPAEQFCRVFWALADALLLLTERTPAVH